MGSFSVGKGRGAPDWMHDEIGNENLPPDSLYNDSLRSLNLASGAGIAVYEAMRQLKGSPEIKRSLKKSVPSLEAPLHTLECVLSNAL